MAGVGPAPKDPSRRARRNADPVPQTVLQFVAGEQPELPSGYDWPERTRDWWAMWASSAQADLFTPTDWDFLLDTAMVHAELWSGNIGAAAELRLRVAKFGATPEDRARLRITFAEADEKDANRPAGDGGAARQRYGNLRAVSGDPAPVIPLESKPKPAKRASRRAASSG